MKRFLMFLTMVLFAMPMLYGYDSVRTTSTTVYMQESAIEQALYYTTMDTEDQLNYFSTVTDTRSYSIENVTIAQTGLNEFIGAINEFDGLKSTIDASLEYAFAIMTETNTAPAIRFIAIVDGMFHRATLQDNTGYIVAGFPSSLIGSNTIAEIDSDMVYSSYGSSLATVQPGLLSLLIGSNTIATTDSGTIYAYRGQTIITAKQPETLEVGYNYPYC